MQKKDPRYKIYINQEEIKKARVKYDSGFPVAIYDTENKKNTFCHEACITGDSKVVFSRVADENRACVWIETDTEPKVLK